MKIEFELIPRSDLELRDNYVAYDSATVTMKPGMISIPVLLFLGGESDSSSSIYNNVYRVTLKEDKP